MASGQDAHRGERPPRTARDASRGVSMSRPDIETPGRHRGKKSGGAGRDPSYKMGEGIVFSTVFFWRLRPEIGSNCHPVGSSSKTPQMRCKLSAWKRVRQGEKARQNAAQAVVFRQGAGFTR